MGGTIVYPGTFDPITNGHVDLIKRALKLFDRVIVAVGVHPGKKPLFNCDERVEMIRMTVGQLPNVEVEKFHGLLVNFAKERGAKTILRGLRAVSDFEYELQRAIMNRKLDRDVETVFLMTGFRYIFVSSTIVKEAAQFGGSLDGLVPPLVEERIRQKFRERIKG